MLLVVVGVALVGLVLGALVASKGTGKSNTPAPTNRR
jgi:hypothetical protein